MKKVLTILLLVFTLSVFSQTTIRSNTNAVEGSLYQSLGNAYMEDGKTVTSESKNIATTLSPVRSKTFTSVKNAEDGYYIVANVFGKKRNLKKFGKTLEKKGISSNYIEHNNLNYIYLKQYSSWQEAKQACATKLNGSYSNELWVMIVDNGNLVNASIAKGVLITTQTKKQKPTEKLIEKAALYFDKMWYAEAAKLYEEALKKDKENYTFDILQKTGDAHYFNTNMEKAHYWYSVLYDRFKDNMSADNLFKYAHTLKGTGKYARSKKLMRLYNRKVKSSPQQDLNNQEQTPNEIILDQILSVNGKTEIKNLNINTKYSEFSPIFYNQDDLVFSSAKDSSFLHTRRYKWNDQPYLDLYVAKINQESQELRNTTKFSKKINTKYHEASVAFSPDNKTMYFTRNNYGKKLRRDKNGINHLKIYRSKKVEGEWTEAKEVSFNSDNYSTGHPAISPDGKKMYFVSDMPGSIGMTDIFVVDINEDGSFSEPKNLGPQINTERKEMFPFINDKKLYFSSDGHVGIGNLDIFEASFLEEGDGFGEAVNLGMPINSEKDDFSYIVDEETQKGFFASNRKGGKGDDDIYSFKRLFPEEKEQNAIAGVAIDIITGEFIPKAMILLLDENNIKLKEMQTDEGGNFIFEDLKSDTKYTLKSTKETYFDDIATATTKKNDTLTVNIAFRKLKEMIVVENGIKKLKTEMIYFNFDKSFIRKDAAEELDKLVETMTEYKNMVIKIESHTDARGVATYNKYLSDKRAKSSRDYIISKGINPNRIESAIGYGEERLLNECSDGVSCSRDKHQINRRSEFIIVSM